MEPSPTAEATRLTEPERTSPAANTPGLLVSSKNGCRRAVQCGDFASAGPVWTNGDGNATERRKADPSREPATSQRPCFAPGFPTDRAEGNAKRRERILSAPL